GSCKPEFFRRRLASQIADWEGREPFVLDNEEMDLAVSLGAAWYGLALKKDKGKIRGGYPRSLYVEVEHAGQESASLVCLIPKGFEAEKPVTLDKLDLKAITEQPVRFQLFSSHRREADRPGDIIPLA